MTMEQYAGIDVSVEASHVCVVDAQGKILKEAKVASEPEALIAWFAAHGTPMARIGLEAGPLSQWLFAEMKVARLAGGTARDAPCTRRLQGHAGQDRSHGRPRHRPADALGLVSPRALQVAPGPGGPGASDHPQAPAGQAPGCRDEPAGR